MFKNHHEAHNQIGDSRRFVFLFKLLLEMMHILVPNHAVRRTFPKLHWRWPFPSKCSSKQTRKTCSFLLLLKPLQHASRLPFSGTDSSIYLLHPVFIWTKCQQRKLGAWESSFSTILKWVYRWGLLGLDVNQSYLTGAINFVWNDLGLCLFLAVIQRKRGGKSNGTLKRSKGSSETRHDAVSCGC